MPAPWRTVRVFISSTFRDMHAERDHLVRFVFPKLREELLKRRIHLVDVDLRWGVTAEQDSLQLCKEIIDECRPRFLCILGGRYGWVPPGQETSITAAEIRYGVLDPLGDHGYAYFYFRDLQATAAMVEETPGEFREPPGSANEGKLAALKQAITEAGLAPRTYAAQWDAQQRRLVGLQAFGEMVCADLLASIVDEFGPAAPAEVDEFAEEQALMEAFVAERVERYVVGSRQPLLDELTQFAQADGKPNILLLVGSPGSGKSALLAKLYLDLSQSEIRDPKSAIVIPHFIGASSGSTDLHRTLRRFCHALSTALGVTEPLPFDVFQLMEKFSTLLTQAASERRVVLLVDALNQFDSTDSPQGMHWLPRELPANVRIILSTMVTAPQDPSAWTNPEVQALRKRGQQLRETVLRPLTQDDALAIVRGFLRRYHKQMSAEQFAAFLAKPETGSPLYLLVALEELRTLGTYEEITERIGQLPENVHALFRWILTVRLAADPGFRDAAGHQIGAELVRRLASLLGASRYGLSQAELMELVEPGDRLGNVAALLRLLRPYLMRRGESLDFYHSQFRDAVAAEYLDEESERIAAHRTLAAFFQSKADPAGDATWAGESPRACRELPHHVFEARAHETSVALARDTRFLAAQDRSSPGDPQVALTTIRLALQTAIERDDAGKMAEFSLRHAKRVLSLAQESPLDALRAGNLQRAWGLADLYDIERCSLWYLLLAWELKESGRWEETKETLTRLGKKPLPRLSGWQGNLAVTLLSETACSTGEAVCHLVLSLFGECDLVDFCSAVSTKRHASVAVAIAQRVGDARHRAATFRAIAEAQTRAGGYAQARETASRIEDAKEQAMSLRAIAVDQAQAGELTQALEAAQRIEDATDRAEALRAIAEAQARAGGYAQALAMAQDIGEEESRAEALRTIAKAQAAAGQRAEARAIFTQALEAAQRMQDTRLRALALSEIAEAQAAAGQHREARRSFTQALRAAKRAQSAWSRMSGLRAIAEAQARARSYAETFARGAHIKEERSWTATLRDIAAKLFKTGYLAQALETVRQIEEPRDRALALIAIAEAQAGAGHRVEARRIITQALQTARRIERARHRVDALVALAAAQERAGDHAQALETVPWIKEAEAHTRTLQAIAEAQAAAGQPREARQTFTQALKAAERVESGLLRALVLQEIAAAQARTGDHVEALATAARIKEEWNWAATLRDIAAEQVKMGDFAQALQTAQRIEDAEDQATSLAAIADAQAGAGHGAEARRTFGQALEAAGRIESARKQAEALRSIAAEQMKAGDLAQALATTEGIEEERVRAATLGAIAQAQLVAGHRAEARRTFGQALEAARRIESARKQAEALQAIAEAQAAADQRTEARRTWVQAREAAERIQGRSGRAWALREITHAQARAGHYAEAFETAQRIEDAEERATSLAGIANAQAAAGHGAEARRTFAQAVQTTRRIREGWVRAAILQAIANVQVWAGDYAEAFETAQQIESAPSRAYVLRAIAQAQAWAGDYAQARETTQRIEDAEERATSLAGIANAQAAAGHGAEARRTFAQALATAQGIGGEHSRARAFREIAVAQAQAGEVTQALATAQDIGQDIGEEESRAEALRAIAKAQAAAGQRAEARAIFTQALEAARRIEDAGDRVAALTKIGETQAAVGDRAEVGRTFAQALESAQHIQSAKDREVALCGIARQQARMGLEDEAIWTARQILSEPKKGLPDIALAFVESQKAIGFKRLLIPCSDYLDATYRMCGLLAKLYPDRATAIAEAIRNET